MLLEAILYRYGMCKQNLIT